MNGLYLQYEKLWKVPTKDGKKVNVLCIVDGNHGISVVVLYPFRKRYLVDSGVQHRK